MEVFTKEALLIDILDTICTKLNIHSSAFVFLSRCYSDEEIQSLYSYLAKVEIKKEKVSTTEIISKIQEIKPDTSSQTAEATIHELIAAFQDEERFPWIISQLKL